MSLLQVKGLGKVYNTKLGMRQCVALKNVSFEVIEGEFVAIMGASGSGKTTLLNILASLDKPTTGDVLLDGVSFSSIADRGLSEFRRKHLGFVFQDFNLLDTFSIKDNILLPLVLMQTPLREMEERLLPIARQLGITQLLSKYPFEVSGGEKQKIAIVRQLLKSPDVMLFDEPTSALDAKSRGALIKLLHEIKRDHIVIVVTHDEEMLAACDEVISTAG